MNVRIFSLLSCFGVHIKLYFSSAGDQLLMEKTRAASEMESVTV
jgi:hypothetical protein